MYYILDENKEIHPCSLHELAHFWDSPERIVSREELKDGSVVSTVFLCIDHNHSSEGNPILFETMLLGGDLDYMKRYSTYHEAIAGHEELVRTLKLKQDDT